MMAHSPRGETERDRARATFECRWSHWTHVLSLCTSVSDDVVEATGLQGDALAFRTGGCVSSASATPSAPCATNIPLYECRRSFPLRVAARRAGRDNEQAVRGTGGASKRAACAPPGGCRKLSAPGTRAVGL